MAYAMEFREVVARAYDECGSSIEVAEQFNCSESRVGRQVARPLAVSGHVERVAVANVETCLP